MKTVTYEPRPPFDRADGSGVLPEEVSRIVAERRPGIRDDRATAPCRGKRAGLECRRPMGGVP
jgi:hypothetical protein